MDYKRILEESLILARQRKRLILFFVAAHAVFLFFGQLTMSWQMPGVVDLRVELMAEIKDLPYLKPLVGPLATSLGLKIIYTFFFNFIFGALLSTTVSGVVFFIPYVIAVWRSFIIGVLFYGLDVSPLQATVFYGTALLEFGAYCVSSAVGTDIGLSLLWPGRKNVTSRGEALAVCLNEGKTLYVLVILLLFLGAVWEIGWLHYLGPIIGPGAPD